MNGRDYEDVSEKLHEEKQINHSLRQHNDTLKALNEYLYGTIDLEMEYSKHLESRPSIMVSTFRNPC